VIDGKIYCNNTYDRIVSSVKDNKIIYNYTPSNEKIKPTGDQISLYAKSSSNIDDIKFKEIDLIITDPPYASNVNYSELSDFFYVWLRLILSENYIEFSPEITPKMEEIIENPTRKKTADDFKAGLESVFRECKRISKDDGVMVFTFHHADDAAWEALLTAICNAGYYVEAVIPIHGEAESSLHLMNNEGISYDLIHVCRIQPAEKEKSRRSWAGVRQEIRRKAREEARIIESGRYGNEPLTPADINILLIGKCLELYSKHYGVIVDHEDRPISLRKALEEIKMLVDQIVGSKRPLPVALQNIDVPSYIYFTTLFAQREIKSDDINKNTRAIQIDTAQLKKLGLIIKGRENRGRTFEVKQPIERLNDLKERFQSITLDTQQNLFDENGTEAKLPDDVLFVDCIHLLLGTVEAGDNVLPYLERFRGLRPEIRAACEYLIEHNRYESTAKKIMSLIDERTLFTKEG
jgi:putative DNA methylase